MELVQSFSDQTDTQGEDTKRRKRRKAVAEQMMVNTVNDTTGSCSFCTYLPLFVPVAIVRAYINCLFHYIHDQLFATSSLRGLCCNHMTVTYFSMEYLQGSSDEKSSEVL